MKIHILGICGTFMGSLALLARQLGHQVQGCDTNVYPPMSTQLQEQGITLIEGFDPLQLNYQPDCIIIGNALTRGNPIVEFILNQKLAYTSGPQWLTEHILQPYRVLAVAGTHGKTTTSSMLAWILQYAGLNPSFLIGGIPENFGISAQLNEGKFFVIEADEYDSAFFDKRSKFIHYHPEVAILNNLEYDHADIFPDLQAIQTQFHHLVRTVPGQGLIIAPKDNATLQTVLQQGCWSPIQWLGKDWSYQLLAEDGSAFSVQQQDRIIGEVHWSLLGLHNVGNALSAIAAAIHIGVTASQAIAALSSFKHVKRRMQLIANHRGIKIYDDFAHHPTAISSTLQSLHKHITKQERIIAIVEMGSNTMRSGVHDQALMAALALADQSWLYLPHEANNQLANNQKIHVFHNTEHILQQAKTTLQSGDNVIIMSNRSFNGLHEKLVTQTELT